MAAWDAIGAMAGSKADEPDEDNVPFIMRLDNSGLRIVSKMRRINIMVRTHRTFMAWKTQWEKDKQNKASELPLQTHRCNIDDDDQ